MVRLLSVILTGWLVLTWPAFSKAQDQTSDRDLARAQALLSMMRAHQEAAQTKDDKERLQKQIELQQMQIQTLEKMIRLLAEQVKRDVGSEKLSTQVTTLESRAEMAARRDRELAGAVNALREHQDNLDRNGPRLPATLREWFLPSRTNESPVAIYGTLATNFNAFQDTTSNFPSPTFLPHFYMLLNEQFLLEVNPTFVANTIELESAQLDWFLNDHFTLAFGRFYSPLGFFNERLHTTWIFKTPDRPLMFSQVLPAQQSFTGVKLSGATYLFDWPVKFEYATVATNGFSLAAATPTARDFADLRAMKDAFNEVNGDKAYGGRVGLVFPTYGVWIGLSGLLNGAYDRAGQHDLALWDVDFSWHRGNWDFRFELARVHQQAPRRSIHRTGCYAQVAYRPFDSGSPTLRQFEAVARYDYVQFRGIDLAATGLAFGGRENVPIDRNRYTVGLNWYAYESLVFKVAFEVNEELRFRNFQDNGFLAQVAWGF